MLIPILGIASLLFLAVAAAMAMSTYGESTLEQSGTYISVCANQPEWKTGGITFDWSKVTAVSVDTELADGITVKAGDKYLLYGTVVDRITAAAEVQTIDMSPGTDPTGGFFHLVFDFGSGDEETAQVGGLGTAAALQTAIEGLDSVQVGDVAVTKVGQVFTLTWSGRLGNVPAPTVVIDTALGSDTVPAVATGTPGNTGGGLYGPADTSASDGRQTLAVGETFIVEHTVLQSQPRSDHPPVIMGGEVFTQRLQVGGTNQPTLANVLAAMPRLIPVNDAAA